jgi:hypothetical protein
VLKPNYRVPAPSEVTSAHKAPRHMRPPETDGWPSLPSNPLAASIATEVVDPLDPPPAHDPKERWALPQSNTCLFAGDNHGAIYPLIHGTYLAGTIETKPTFSHLMTITTGKKSHYFTRYCVQNGNASLAFQQLTGRIYECQELERPAQFDKREYRLRDILRISTVAKDLGLYIFRNCDEAKIAWVGGGGQEGAREWNMRWCRLLENSQTRSGQGQGSFTIYYYF